MTDAAATSPDATEAPKGTFILDYDIASKSGEVLIPAGTSVAVRKPGAGELRGIKLSELIQGDYASIEMLAPRITTPILHKASVALMDPADLIQLSGEIIYFLLPRSARPESPNI